MENKIKIIIAIMFLGIIGIVIADDLLQEHVEIEKMIYNEDLECIKVYIKEYSDAYIPCIPIGNVTNEKDLEDEIRVYIINIKEAIEQDKNPPIQDNTNQNKLNDLLVGYCRDYPVDKVCN